MRKFRARLSALLLHAGNRHDIARQQHREADHEAVRSEVLDARSGRQRANELAKSTERYEAAVGR